MKSTCAADVQHMRDRMAALGGTLGGGEPARRGDVGDGHGPQQLRPSARGRAPASATGCRLPKVEEHGLDSTVDVVTLGQAQLHEDRGNALLHGAGRQMRLRRDASIAVSLGHQPQDVQLALAELERGDRASRPAGRATAARSLGPAPIRPLPPRARRGRAAPRRLLAACADRRNRRHRRRTATRCTPRRRAGTARRRHSSEHGPDRVRQVYSLVVPVGGIRMSVSSTSGLTRSATS